MPRRDSRPLRRRHAAPTATVAMAPGSQTPRWFRSVAAWAALTGLLAAAAPATALQVLDARDGVAVEAVLSIKEPTRILTGGSYLDLMKAWRVPVYYDQQGTLTRRFGIRQVPALVSQEGMRLRVEEVLVR